MDRPPEISAVREECWHRPIDLTDCDDDKELLASLGEPANFSSKEAWLRLWAVPVDLYTSGQLRTNEELNRERAMDLSDATQLLSIR